MRRRTLHFLPSMFAVAFVVLAVLSVSLSHAGKGRTSAAKDAPSLTCTLVGNTVLPADTKIFDAGSGGDVIGKLTGTKLGFKLSSFPAKPKTGRVKISTSATGKRVNITGFSALSQFRFFAASDLAVDGAPGVWITKGQQLRLVSANAKGFVVERGVLGSKNQKVRATVGCGDVSVEIQAVESVEVPKRARTYQTKKESVTLFDGPGGEKVFELQLEDDTRKVFWSTEGKQGYVRVMSRADITIDAWARYRDLAATRHAELFDLAAVSPRALSERKLEIKDPPPVLTATKELPIHKKAENALHGIGAVEVGAKFYAMERSGDWTNIMPVSLAVLAPDGGGFWVRTAGLPKPPPKPDK